eukprot:4389636-Amphidinium_carterae.1
MEHPPTEVGAVAGSQLFANEKKTDLAEVPGIAPETHYHALIAEQGANCAVKRFREFECFDGNAILPRYVVAYVRGELERGKYSQLPCSLAPMYPSERPKQSHLVFDLSRSGSKWVRSGFQASTPTF